MTLILTNRSVSAQKSIGLTNGVEFCEDLLLDVQRFEDGLTMECVWDRSDASKATATISKPHLHDQITVGQSGVVGRRIESRPCGILRNFDWCQINFT